MSHLPLDPVFSGFFRHSVDAKNRFTIPSKWRTESSEANSAKEVHCCLYVKTEEEKNNPEIPTPTFTIYTKKKRERIIEEIKSDPRLSPVAREKIKRKINRNSHPCSIDSAHRINLPDKSQSKHEDNFKALISSKVVLSGIDDDYIEVWKEEDYDKALSEEHQDVDIEDIIAENRW